MVAQTISQPRFQAFILASFAVLALTIAAIGQYALLAYFVGRRNREIGVRLALGATRMGVIRLILSKSMWSAVIGLGIGLVASIGVTRYVSAVLYGVEAFDPLTIATVGGVLLTVAVLASIGPALRASRIDPVRSLRAE